MMKYPKLLRFSKDLTLTTSISSGVKDSEHRAKMKKMFKRLSRYLIKVELEQEVVS